MENAFCTQCGAKLRQGVRFCPQCGAEVERPLSATRNQREKRKRGQQRSRLPSGPAILAFAGGALLILGAILYLSGRGQPGPAAATASAPPGSAGAADLPFPEVPRISLAAAKAGSDAGTALIVDVRSQAEYDTAHIPNAVSLPLVDLGARFRELPTNVEVVTY